MRFKVAVIAILGAILGVTAVGTVMVVQEAKEQTKIALRTAEITALQADLEAYTSILERNKEGWNVDFWIADHAGQEIDRIQEIFAELDIQGETGTEIYHSVGYKSIIEEIGN